MIHQRQRARRRRQQQDTTENSASHQPTTPHHQPENSASHHPLHEPQTAEEVLHLQRLIGNAAVQRMMNPIQRDAPEPPTKTGYLGFNPAASKEARALKGRLNDDVIIALNDPAMEAELQTEAGIVKWLIEKANLNPIFHFGTFFRAYDCLLQTDSAARDSMAQMITMLAGAERGEYTLERLVMSGHSNGVALWGDDTATHKAGGFILDQDLTRLAEAFPGAAGQIQDIMFSACFSVNAIHLVVKIFPNLQTVWGYARFSPSIEKGSVGHIKKWEQETRGEQTLQQSDGRGSAALWTREEADKGGTGFIRNDPADIPLEDLWSQYSERHFDYVEQFNGDAEIDSEMIFFYITIQDLLNHPDLDASDRAGLEEEREIVLRMRFWDKICDRFSSEYKALIETAYPAVGLPVPNYDVMPRKRLLTQIETFGEALKLKPNPDAQQFYDKYMRGLWTLTDNEVVPTSWI